MTKQKMKLPRLQKIAGACQRQGKDCGVTGAGKLFIIFGFKLFAKKLFLALNLASFEKFVSPSAYLYIGD